MPESIAYRHATYGRMASSHPARPATTAEFGLAEATKGHGRNPFRRRGRQQRCFVCNEPIERV